MKNLKNAYLNKLESSKESLTQLTGKQVGAIILYVICTLLVQLGSYSIGMKLYEIYEALIRKFYEKHNLEFTKRSKLVHSIISTIIILLCIYGAAYTIGYLFGKFVLRKVFPEE